MSESSHQSLPRRDDWQLMLVPASRHCLPGDFPGMIPEPPGHHGDRHQRRVFKAVRGAWRRQPRMSVSCFVVLIPFLRKLITDKAERLPRNAGDCRFVAL